MWLLRGCRWMLVDLCRDGTLPVIVLSILLARLVRLVLPSGLVEPWREILWVALAFGLGWLAWRAACEVSTLWRCRRYFVGLWRGHRVMREMRRLELQVEIARPSSTRVAALKAYLAAGDLNGFSGGRPTPKDMPEWMVFVCRCLYARRRVELEALRRELGRPDELRRAVWDGCLLLMDRPDDGNGVGGIPVPPALLQGNITAPSMN